MVNPGRLCLEIELATVSCEKVTLRCIWHSLGLTSVAAESEFVVGKALFCLACMHQLFPTHIENVFGGMQVTVNWM